jgi:cytoskeletal protein RodZ
MVDSVGKRLQRARLAKKLEIDDVADSTKIRPERIIDLEADEYGHFPNLTYAKSFLAKYARFLELDIQEELENFHISKTISLGDYQYLASAPAPDFSPVKPSLRPKAFHVPPWIVAALILVVLVGIPAMSFLSYKASRVSGTRGIEAQDNLAVEAATPSTSRSEPPQSLAQAPTAAPAKQSSGAGRPSASEVGSENPIFAVAPNEKRMEGGVEVRKALPVGAVPAAPAPSVAPTPGASIAPADKANVEVRRALPVDAAPAASASSAPSASIGPAEKLNVGPPPEKTLEVRVLKRTWVKVTKDTEGTQPVFEGFTGPDSHPIVVEGKRFWVNVLDKGAIEIRKDGQLVVNNSEDLVIH